MTRRLAMSVLALVLALAGDAAAESARDKLQKAPDKAQKIQKEKKAPAAQKLPLHLYLAKGDADACGPGCSEWIAVEGTFDGGAAARVQAFLNRHGARKLPMYFQSPGGSESAALAIGRQLRQLGIATGVAQTIPRGCESAGDQSNACRAAKRQNQAVTAEWRPDANCSSACVWAMIGGRVRHVPPSARLGVHASKLTLVRKYADGRVQPVSASEAPSLHKASHAQSIERTRRYLRDMGVDTKLLDTAFKTPHESIYYLNRHEIASFGIDRRGFAETPWFMQDARSGSFLGKWIVQARGPTQNDYRASLVLLSCWQPQYAGLLYLRGLASDEIGKPLSAAFSIGKHKTVVSLPGSGTKHDGIDTGSLFSTGAGFVAFSAFEAVTTSINVLETDPPTAAARAPRVITLSADGLAEGIKILRDKCSQPTAGWGSGAQVPFVPGHAGSQATPGTAGTDLGAGKDQGRK
jgi:hypothetical protein